MASVDPNVNPFLTRLNEHEDENVKHGGAILSNAPHAFPARRKMQDVIWAGLFLLVCALLPILAYIESNGFTFKRAGQTAVELENTIQIQFTPIIAAVWTSACAAMLFSMAFVALTKTMTACVVWTALLFSPLIMIGGGGACIMFGLGMGEQGMALLVIGAVLMAMGLCSLACALCCWASLVPFTIEVLKPVAATLMDHKPLFLVSIFGMGASIVWSLLSFAACFGTFDRMQRQMADNKGEMQDPSFYAIYFGICVLFFWGSMVFQNCCHVTNIGVFGRWYFGKVVTVMESAKVAFMTSFGSICLGSLIIAVIQATEATLSLMRRQAASGEANAAKIIALVVVCILECIVRCIREIAEAFTYFAYVQVGLRGLSFCDSARATFALCTFGNIFYLLTLCLVDNVVSMGVLLVGLSSAGLGALIANAATPNADAVFKADDRLATLTACIIASIFSGLVVAGTFLTILRSGFATICVCYAEDEEGKALERNSPTLHTAFEERTGARERAQGIADG